MTETITITWGGESYTLTLDLAGNATIESKRIRRHGTFCGELLHDFLGRNFVDPRILTALEAEL